MYFDEKGLKFIFLQCEMLDINKILELFVDIIYLYSYASTLTNSEVVIPTAHIFIFLLFISMKNSSTWFHSNPSRCYLVFLNGWSKCLLRLEMRFFVLQECFTILIDIEEKYTIFVGPYNDEVFYMIHVLKMFLKDQNVFNRCIFFQKKKHLFCW